MRCLSIRPPWSLVVADGRKTMENRSRRTRLRERILIHSGTKYVDDAEDFIRNACRKLHLPVPSIEELRGTPRGAIIGAATIVDCFDLDLVPKGQRPWAMGPYCYLLKDAQMFKRPIPHRGVLGFFTVDNEIVLRALKTSRS